MILDVEVTEYRHVVMPQEIGLTRDRQTVSILRNDYIPSWFSNESRWQWKADLTAGHGFQWYVDKYSEVTTLNPWDDIELYFQRLAKVRQGSLPATGGLLYPVNHPVLNIAAMASASEALAGWFCETRYNWNLVDRPSRVTPDMVFSSDDGSRLALVEVKSTSQSRNVGGKMTTEMIDLLRILAPTKLLHPGSYYAALIMVQITGANSVNLTSLVLEEV